MEDVYNAVVSVTIAVGRSKLLYLLYVIGKRCYGMSVVGVRNEMITESTGLYGLGKVYIRRERQEIRVPSVEYRG